MLPFLPFPPLFPLTFSIVRWLGKRSGVTAKMWAFLMFLTKSSTDDSKLCRLLFPNYQRMQQQKNISSTCADIKYAQNTHWQPTTNRHIIHVMPLTSRGFPSVSWLPAHYDQLEALSSLVDIRCPASVTFSLIYTIRCFKPHNPYIISVFIRKVLHFLTSRGFKDIKYNPHRPLRAWRPWWPLLAMVPLLAWRSLTQPWANTEQTLTPSTHWPKTENTCVILCL